MPSLRPLTLGETVLSDAASLQGPRVQSSLTQEEGVGPAQGTASIQATEEEEGEAGPGQGEEEHWALSKPLHPRFPGRLRCFVGRDQEAL